MRQQSEGKIGFKMPFWEKTKLNMMNIDQIHFEIRRSTLIKTIKNEIMRLKSLKFESLELSAWILSFTANWIESWFSSLRRVLGYRSKNHESVYFVETRSIYPSNFLVFRAEIEYRHKNLIFQNFEKSWFFCPVQINGSFQRRGEEEEWNRVKMQFLKKTNLNMMNIDQIHF